MLVLNALSLYRGPRPLFKGASFTIFPGHKVGLTGANGSAMPFDGELEDYRRWISQHDATVEKDERGNVEHSAEARKARRRNEAERRQRLRPLKAAVERWEATITRLESQRDTLQRQLAELGLYQEESQGRLRALLDEQALVTKDLAAAESQWLKAGEVLETAERES